jgi:hypothetical protein
MSHMAEHPEPQTQSRHSLHTEIEILKHGARVVHAVHVQVGTFRTINHNIRVDWAQTCALPLHVEFHFVCRPS